MPNSHVPAAAEGVPADTAPAAMPDFRRAFEALEVKISRVVRFTQALDYLTVEDLIQKVSDRHGVFYRLDETAGDVVLFLAEETKRAALDLEQAWSATRTAACDAEFRAMTDGML